ncbi:hypothetical protein [Caenispirillum bisanense]|uniref:Uncharacterized protein n=1 Tax=Caenispirillum bisanense TaxID=414052 RepID=A0A286GHQ2_9PROT|nr:hypothetical protein [Caenispirillum bisanense]SOD94639.1 hypothetical protein SAMN05421508_10468 [Caenispirillum bisanense]
MTTAAARSDALLASARASRAAAEKFRTEVERLKGVSFEGSLAAVAEFRLMARDLMAGSSALAARANAQATVNARLGVVPQLAAAE